MTEGLGGDQAQRVSAAGVADADPGRMDAVLDAAAGCRFSRSVLGRAVKIDPQARSSMWEDLQRGRRTEIDYLQGVIVEMARIGTA